MAENAVNTEQGVILEALNYKADLDGNNVAGTGFEDYIKSLIGSSGGDSDVYIIDSYVNGDSGYIVWSNGMCEQWGFMEGTYPVTGTFTFNLLKNYKNRNYFVSTSIDHHYTPKSQYTPETNYYGRQGFFEESIEKTISNFASISPATGNGTVTNIYWYTKGFVI